MSEVDQSDTQPDSADRDSGRRLELEATLTHHFTPPERQIVQGASPGTKQMMDLAMTVALLREGAINERQLAQLVSNWTSFGTTTFAEHAFREGFVSNQQAGDAHARARS